MVVSTMDPKAKVGDIIISPGRECELPDGPGYTRKKWIPAGVNVIVKVDGRGNNGYAMYPGWEAFVRECLMFATGDYGADRQQSAMRRLEEIGRFLDEIRPLESPSRWDTPIADQLGDIAAFSEKIKADDAMGIPYDTGFDDDDLDD